MSRVDLAFLRSFGKIEKTLLGKIGFGRRDMEKCRAECIHYDMPPVIRCEEKEEGKLEDDECDGAINIKVNITYGCCSYVVVKSALHIRSAFTSVVQGRIPAAEIHQLE